MNFFVRKYFEFLLSILLWLSVCLYDVIETIIISTNADTKMCSTEHPFFFFGKKFNGKIFVFMSIKPSPTFLFFKWGILQEKAQLREGNWRGVPKNLGYFLQKGWRDF